MTADDVITSDARSATRATSHTNRMAIALLAGYVGLGIATVIADVVDSRLGVVLTKPLLMPILVVYAATSLPRHAPRLLVAGGLAGGAVGDIALLTPDGFLIGMAAFALGHGCYLAAFVRVGALSRIRFRWWVPVGYAVLWAGLTALLVPRLDELGMPVAGYSVLLAAMATAAAGANWMAGLGGFLFLLSDTVLGLGLADIEVITRQDLAVMPTYLAAQLLLTLSWRAVPAVTG